MNEKINQYRQIIENALKENTLSHQFPKELYEPCDYILEIGGKRIRPLLVLLGTDLFDGNAEAALKPALAIEFFHNFTLMHDDIMDDAPLRRGKPSVHVHYDTDTAILSGDALFVQAYRMFEDLPALTFKKVLQMFSKTAQEVCEGQQLDKNFETAERVTYEAYIRMIELKTAVLVGAALQIGAMTAGADESQQRMIYEFGKNLGIAFQLQDDYLDVFGNPGFGKIHAGDIVENKKTILYILAETSAGEKEAETLRKWYAQQTDNPEKISAVKDIFIHSGADTAVKQLIQTFTQKAMNSLEQIEVMEEKKLPLKTLAKDLMQREI